MYYFYIIYSKGSDLYYIGISENPERRLKEHNFKPFNTYTSEHRPRELSAIFAISKDRKAAFSYERKLKSLKGRRIIEQLVSNNGDNEILAQLIRIPTCWVNHPDKSGPGFPIHRERGSKRLP